jgi:potassium voltage-gated channel Shab-related subfamily B protein 2
MEYWGVDDLYLEPCCVQRYYQQRELLNWDHQIKKEEENEVFRPGRVGRLQKVLWELFEKPHTSLGARVRIQDSIYIQLYITCGMNTTTLTRHRSTSVITCC